MNTAADGVTSTGKDRLLRQLAPSSGCLKLKGRCGFLKMTTVDHSAAYDTQTNQKSQCISSTKTSCCLYCLDQGVQHFRCADFRPVLPLTSETTFSKMHHLPFHYGVRFRIMLCFCICVRSVYTNGKGSHFGPIFVFKDGP